MALRATSQLVRANTGNVTTVSASATNVTLLSNNPERGGAIIFNDSASAVYVKFGETATTSSFTYKMGAGDHLVLDAEAALYTGVIDGIWDTATGNARVTELV